MPAGNSLRTSWQPASPIPLPEYPRPQMTRPNLVEFEWLVGFCHYSPKPKQAGSNGWKNSGSLCCGIAAVRCPASPVAGRTPVVSPAIFIAHKNGHGNQILLHFGAVDYSCQVWINGISVGTHTGGFVPFTFDITGALNGQENDLLIAVDDPSDSRLQARGKQKLQPRGIWYTAVSGIWQTVWLEPVPDTSIASLKITPDLDTSTVRVEAALRGNITDLSLRASVLEDGKEIAACQANPNEPLLLTIPNPRPWSPQDPHLYPLHIQLERDGVVLDEVESYFALRKFSLVKDKQGNKRFALNNKPLFLFGPLDQGYFPDGLYTPPSEEAMLFDIEYTRNIGCNMIRKHVKVEPSRWYYHCDRLGMIVWQDMPNGGTLDSDIVAYLAIMANLKRNDTGRQEKSHREQFLKELREMVDHLYSFPCIGAWVPFNESWGQFDAKQVADWLRHTTPPGWLIMPPVGLTRVVVILRVNIFTSNVCRFSNQMPTGLQ